MVPKRTFRLTIASERSANLTYARRESQVDFVMLQIQTCCLKLLRKYQNIGVNQRPEGLSNMTDDVFAKKMRKFCLRHPAVPSYSN